MMSMMSLWESAPSSLPFGFRATPAARSLTCRILFAEITMSPARQFPLPSPPPPQKRILLGAQPAQPRFEPIRTMNLLRIESMKGFAEFTGRWLGMLALAAGGLLTDRANAQV